MTSAGFPVAAALTRAWVRLYTIAMPLDLRETRRAEIDADLWDHAKDAHENGVGPAVFAMEILLRAILGVADDVSWRFEAIQLRRIASPEGRIPMMALSEKRIRWMGLGGLLGGLLWAGNALAKPVGLGAWDYGHIAVSLLLIAGLVGLYGQERGRAGKVARSGFILLFTSLLAWSALLVLGMVFAVSGKALLMEVLGVTFVFLLPPGFLLLGLGLKGPIRRVPLALGSLFVAWILVPRALLRVFPSAADFLRPGGDSPLGVMVLFLMGVGVALMGYAVFRNAAPAPTSRG